jgi:phospho-N-acetylmuramoyl-pentapeptide-transferase
VQEYITNSIIAATIAVIASVLMGPIMIPFLRRLKVGQSIREEGPKRHFAKAGTPTMGGIIIITAVMLATFIMAGNNSETLAAVLLMLVYAAIGFCDDYIKVVLKRSLGLRAREKILLQVLTGLFFALMLMYFFHRGTAIIIPFTSIVIDLGYLYIPFVMFVIIAAANAVNLTDGLDGLASGVTLFVALGLLLICLMTSHYQLSIFCGALAGACIGFLFFNRYPARIFMGDTGSMALGGAIAAVAALTRSELGLVILGGVYVIEALSVIIQVFFYQTTGKRIFLMSPLHHHFELKGWSETRIVKVFSIASLVFVVFGLMALKGVGIR